MCDLTSNIHQGLSHCFVSEVSVEYLHRLLLCGQFSNMFFISFLPCAYASLQVRAPLTGLAHHDPCTPSLSV